MNKLKRAVFTVEAAVIVPLASMIIAALIGYIFFMHENVWSRAAAYESALYAVQYFGDDRTVKESAKERIDERYGDRILWFAQNDPKISEKNESVDITWEYGILQEIFGDLFTVNSNIKVGMQDPVQIKRFSWLFEQVNDQG